MSKFIQNGTGVVVSVSDEKDYRFAEGWESADAPRKTTTRKKSSASDSSSDE